MAKTYSSGPHTQRGVGMFAAFVMLAIGLFLGMFALKLVPVYIDNWTVQKIVEKSSEDPNLLKQSQAKIYDHLNGAYRQNNLWDLTAEDTVVLKRAARSKGYNMFVKYESRTNFISNISLVTSFGDDAEKSK